MTRYSMPRYSMPREVSPIPVGTRFGDRTVIAPSTRDKTGKVMYLCACVCGVQSPVAKGRLVAGISQRCHACAKKLEKTKHLEQSLSAFETGSQYGNQTVVGEPVQNDRGEFLIPCVCTCGARTSLSRGLLLGEKPYRCQACKYDSKQRKPIKPLIYAIGDKLGSWTINGPVIIQPKGVRYWPCVCDCGRQQPVKERRLKSTETMSCQSCGNRRDNGSKAQKKVPQTLRHACEALEAAKNLDDRVFELRKAKYEKVLAAFEEALGELTDGSREDFEAELKEVKERIAKLR